MSSYLQDLTIRLATGMGELPEEQRQRHTQFILSAQQADGGFGGREGGSDLYYTGFALRSLAILGELYGETADRTAEFLRQRLGGQETIIDFLSLVYGAALVDSAAGIDVFAGAGSRWRERIAETLERLRRDDGGYAKGPLGAASSTYHTFLVLLCQQLIERPVPRPERILEFLEKQRSEEGGYREIKIGKRAGTNPTAAAIGSLRILEAINDDIADDTIEFLAEMQTEEGGFRANTRIPIADLLSTFTALLTLADLDGIDTIELPAVRRFAHSLEDTSGGFLAAAWDQARDVEYTFYGLGTLALLATLQPANQ